MALITLRTVGRGRVDRGVTSTPEVDDALASGAPVAIGVSGGKDSCALALATLEHLDAIAHTGPRVLIHSDLGRVEWRDSLPTCERLAQVTGLPLVVVRRKAGDMLARWQVRWQNNVARYADLECVRLILPWSTPAMRFCTSELKTAIITRDLTLRFAGQTILSASGIRREESSNRAKAPVVKRQPKLESRTQRTTGYDWHPIIDWTAADVYSYLDHRGFALHEAYTKYGASRVSCAFCIMSSAPDLVASASCPDNQEVYRAMVDLEIESTFAFQARWLGDVAPHLLTEEQRAGLASAKARAALREQIEARIPKHLLYVEGWPTAVPTPEEAELLAGVRREVASVMDLDGVRYTTAGEVADRYRELMAARDARPRRAA